MATAKGSNTYNRLNWEESDFPILCQTCLGDNPYIRMTKEKWGQECKICERPFTVFRWCPGAKMRFKKTEICQTCSKIKNICQTCLLDLEYGLPTQVRDAALKIKEDLPKSSVNKEYFIQNMEKELAETHNPLGKMQNPNDMLLKLARTAPYYKRNRPHICSFWVKGECKRGEECPYRHEKPSDPDDPLSDQNIRDRYYGVNDPVADKLLRRAQDMPKLEAPDDKSISTLYVGNLGEGKVTEKDLRNFFYQYGEIRSVSIIARQQCAFIQFTSRLAAENAAEQSYNKLILNGRRLILKWGKSNGQLTKKQMEGDAQYMANILPPVPGLPTALPLPPQEIVQNYFNLTTPAGINSTLPPPPPQSLPPIDPEGGVRDFKMAPKIDSTLLPSLMVPPPPPAAASQQSSSGGGTMLPPPMIPPVGKGYGNRTIHYPSQDPQREGSIVKYGDSKIEEKIAAEYAEPE